MKQHRAAAAEQHCEGAHCAKSSILLTLTNFSASVRQRLQCKPRRICVRQSLQCKPRRIRWRDPATLPVAAEAAAAAAELRAQAALEAQVRV